MAIRRERDPDSPPRVKVGIDPDPVVVWCNEDLTALYDRLLMTVGEQLGKRKPVRPAFIAFAVERRAWYHDHDAPGNHTIFISDDEGELRQAGAHVIYSLAEISERLRRLGNGKSRDTAIRLYLVAEASRQFYRARWAWHTWASEDYWTDYDAEEIPDMTPFR